MSDVPQFLPHLAPAAAAAPTAALLVVAVLAAGVVYGTDVFFALVGRAALARTRDAALVDVVGHLHGVADRRMVAVGATALASTLAYALTAGVGTASGRLALVALGALAAHLAVYRGVAAPINARLTAAAARGEVPAEARAWQRRWDAVIVPRAVLLAAAMGARGTPGRDARHASRAGPASRPGGCRRADGASASERTSDIAPTLDWPNNQPGIDL